MNKTDSNAEKNLYGDCKICDDEATGEHYGITACSACKVKYERSYL